MAVIAAAVGRRPTRPHSNHRGSLALHVQAQRHDGRIAFALSIFAWSSRGADQRTVFKFDFGSDTTPVGWTRILPTTIYSKEIGYGFEPGAKMSPTPRWRFSVPRIYHERPTVSFSVALPEGNYDVTVMLGSPSGESTNTIKAESRRLMLENVRTARGKFETRTFTVNVRTPKIAGGGEVKLKEREHSYLHWDDKLTLELNGTRPCISALEIAPATNAITVYLAGDSTVTDQPHEPWNSWGQMLTRFFKPGSRSRTTPSRANHSRVLLARIASRKFSAR